MMIALLDTSQDLHLCGEELSCGVGQLLTPLTRYRLRDPLKPWAIDNGAFARFEAKAYLSLLKREEHHKENCIFVTAPDVVGSARRTLEVFDHWKTKLTGWKLALVIQDGQQDLPIPWGEISAVFIGGSTNFKLSAHVQHVIKAAQALDKWVHVGRVNDKERFMYFEELGADSIDGTGLARYTHMREKVGARESQERLFQS